MTRTLSIKDYDPRWPDMFEYLRRAGRTPQLIARLAELGYQHEGEAP